MNVSSDGSLTRRTFALRTAACLSGVGIAGSVFAMAARAQGAPSAAGGEITHNSDAIHQEVDFDASRARVYALLVDEREFDRVVKLSDAMKGGMPPGTRPTSISRDVGGAFTTFGGIIGGRHIEMVPGERLVQAWRPAHWSPGIYSIARFQLVERRAGCRLILDHTGFPNGEAQSLADGWRKNYWQPMAKALT
jgi:activator of HSP90 ATPase